MPNHREKWEFGDFQTPAHFAESCLERLKRWQLQPATIIEPSCGVGGFLNAAVKAYDTRAIVKGYDINPAYVERARSFHSDSNVNVEVADFFSMDWDALLRHAPEPIFIVGNPPWVTASQLGQLESKNLPAKSNFQKHRGLDALTGKSNFDISEWMLLKHFEWLQGRSGVIALLCKTSVARKVLRQMWAQGAAIARAEIVKIDAMLHFGAAVDACFFMVEIHPAGSCQEATVFPDLQAQEPDRTIAEHQGTMFSDMAAFVRTKHLAGTETHYTWRSGIKHDCSKVMELNVTQGALRNGFGEDVDLEDEFLFPILKSSDLAKPSAVTPRKLVIATQRRVGEDTSGIALKAPKTWRYLQAYGSLLDGRKSKIYKRRPRFSVFGVGSYTFAPFKVAISGFYKYLNFKILRPFSGKPIMVDDTGYFIPAYSEREAIFLYDLLTSDQAVEFLSSQIFWDEKRPITVDLLKRFSFEQAAKSVGRIDEYSFYVSAHESEQPKLAF